MQVTLVRGWVLDLQFNVSLRKSVDQARDAVLRSAQFGSRRRDHANRWEQEKAIGIMQSGWETLLHEDRRSRG
jgi:hypothetical protein